MTEISEIRQVKNNADDKIEDYLTQSSSSVTATANNVAAIQEKLKQATADLDVDLITSLSQELQAAISEQQQCDRK